MFDRRCRGAKRGPSTAPARRVLTHLRMSRLLLPVALLVASLFPAQLMAQAAEPDACPSVDVLARRADTASAAPRPGDSLAVPAVPSLAARREPFDIAIIASASASEVRFARQPEIRVRLCGGFDSVRVLERRNLPERIVPGQAYRDVYIAVEVLGRIDAACLARKLGVAPEPDPTRTSLPASSGECAGLTVGAASPPGSGAPGRSPPGTEDAPGRGQDTPGRP